MRSVSNFRFSFDKTFDKAQLYLRKAGIDALDLREGLRAVAVGGPKLYHTIDGHYNPPGMKRPPG